MRRLFVVVALAIVLCGCGKATRVTTPEMAIEAVLAACHVADYVEAARYFEKGSEQYKRTPASVRMFFERISDKGNAVSFVVQDRLERGETLLLQISTYADPEKKQPLRRGVWHFRKAGTGWVLTGVE